MWTQCGRGSVAFPAVSCAEVPLKGVQLHFQVVGRAGLEPATNGL
jgi:hypothetical protein